MSILTTSAMSTHCRRTAVSREAWTAVLVMLLTASAIGHAAEIRRSDNLYRLPYADGTSVKVFDDIRSHRPVGRVDLFGVGGARPYRVVAAAAGRVVAIQDSYAEQQSGRAAADCRNNYVWIAHANGEWSNYSHMAPGSVTQRAGLAVGDEVRAGQYIGDESAVGCAMLDHVHFEVVVPPPAPALDAGGFLRDNEGGKRARDPRFCNVADGSVEKDATYRAMPCAATEEPISGLQPQA